MSRSSSSERLTRARIVAAVTDLLERGGVDAVSTRTIGEALDVHPTALYRHFRDMDELLREAADGILAGLADGAGETAGADGPGDALDALDAVAALCLRLRAVLMSHPGAARVMASGPSRMPNERALTERMLGLLSETGLPDADVTRAYHALIEYVVGSTAIDIAGTNDSADDVDARHRLWRAAYFAASPAEFPHTTRLAALLYPSLDEQFQFAIGLLIAGLRQRVSQLRPAP
jgi:TetR/AcrR family transcriptional regulator, tetracycline repressor protein